MRVGVVGFTWTSLSVIFKKAWVIKYVMVGALRVGRFAFKSSKNSVVTVEDAVASIAQCASVSEKVRLFQTVSMNKKGSVLRTLSIKECQQIMVHLSEDDLVSILNFLDPDEMSDLLHLVDHGIRKRVLSRLETSIRDKVATLFSIYSDTAKGLMSFDYVEVQFDSTFGAVLKVVERHEKKTGKVPVVLVVKDNLLVGELPMYALSISLPTALISSKIQSSVSLSHTGSPEDILHLFRKNPRKRVVVTDRDGCILGVIFSEDVLGVIGKKSSHSLQQFAGVNDEEDVFDSMWVKVRNRYKWLIINLGTAFLAAGVVSLFQDTIAAFTLLAVYMPIVAGMGGNAATQTLAVMVRGIALKEIDLSSARRVIVQEVGAGLVNGIINGVIVAFGAILWNKSPLLGLIVGISMVFNLVVAGFFGAVVPLIMKRLGKDPAASATIFITTATDVLGFLAFLGLASLFVVH